MADKSKKRVQVSFTEKQWELIEEMKDSFGGNDAEAVRNIVVSWLAEKSFISSDIKADMDLD
jgi:hypothetical protein